MKKIFVLLFGILLSTSCKKDFLDRSSLTQLDEKTFWLNAKDAQVGINGVFDVLQDRVLYSGNLNANAGVPLYDGFSDNAFCGFKFVGPGLFVEGNVTPATSLFRDFWNSNFKGIARANQAIQKIGLIDASKISDADRNLLISQAYFLRGLFYFNVAVYFRDAPLITVPQDIKDAYVPKNTQAELLNQVVADLTFAAERLPKDIAASQYGYATKGAAYGLLARVELYRKNWQNAADAALQVINLNKYNLSTPYSTIFTEAGENTSEIIFSVRFQEIAGYNTTETFAATFLAQPKVDQQPMPNMEKEYYCTDGRPRVANPPLYPTASPLYNSNTPKLNRDPRAIASLWFKGDVFVRNAQGQPQTFTNNSTGFGLRKYIHTQNSPLGTSAAGAQSQDFYILRYADILLMRAEALIELGNTGAEVYKLINDVRARVTMPTVQTVEGATLNQSQLRSVLRHERRVELAFEGLRFFDLIRWGEVEQAYSRMKADNIVGYLVNYRGLKSESFPIPIAELDANNKLTQNDAWK